MPAAMPDVPKMQTSIDTNSQAPVTVRFRCWTAFGNTAYMRGQEAGFTSWEAEQLVRRGKAVIVHHLDRSPVQQAPVTK